MIKKLGCIILSIWLINSYFYVNSIAANAESDKIINKELKQENIKPQYKLEPGDKIIPKIPPDDRAPQKTYGIKEGSEKATPKSNIKTLEAK